MSCLILIMLNKQIKVMQSNVNDLISIIFQGKGINTWKPHMQSRNISVNLNIVFQT